MAVVVTCKFDDDPIKNEGATLLCPQVYGTNFQCSRASNS